MYHMLLLCVLGVLPVCSASKSVHDMEMDRTVGINIDKQIESWHLGQKHKISGDFKWANCHNSNPLQVTDLQLPDPIPMGKELPIKVAICVKEDLKNSLDGTLLVQQPDGSKWYNLCPLLADMFHFNCELGNICSLLKKIKKCPKPVIDAGWNCSCPIKKKTYTIANYTIPGIPSVPVQGVFNVSLSLKDTTTKQEVGCFWVQFKLA